MFQITREMKKKMNVKFSTSQWKYHIDAPYKMINEQIGDYPSSFKTEWVVVDFVEEENKIELLWDELKLFLGDSEDFQIIKIKDDSIKIKALNPMAFRKEYVYCRILSNIIPINCNLDLKSHYFQADKPEDDLMTFELSIITDSNLYYRGKIKIIK